MRLFIALDIEDGIRQRIRRFVEGVSGFAPEARWVRPESMHVTLKFIGEKPAEAAEEIKRGVAAVRSQAFEINFRGYGFFPTSKSARVFWVGIESGPQLASLAAAVDEATAALGIPKEEHPYSPHLTLARGGARSGAPSRQNDDRPNRSFQKLQEKLTAMPAPDFGTMTAGEFFLYQSQPMRGGARYTKVERFGLD
jgi:RNA 2',3'-cyclic 3'-phosphodiesterase